MDRHTEPLLHALVHRVRQARRTRHGEAYRRERVVGQFVEVTERHPHRRGTRHHRHLALNDRLHGRGRIEPLDQQHRGTDGQAHPEHHVETEDVEQRQHAVDHVALPDVIASREILLDVRDQVAVAEHRRPRHPGSAAGEHHGGDVIGLDVDGRHRLGRQEIIERDLVVGDITLGSDHRAQRRHPRAVDVRPGGRSRRPDQCRHRFDDGELALDLGCRARRVERDDHGAEAHDREERHDEIPVVGAQHGDPVAGRDALGGEPTTHPFDLVAEFAVRRLAIP